MILGLLLLSCLQILTLAYDFNLSTDGSKLVTWIDANGTNSSLLLFSLQPTVQKVLEKKKNLPYSFVVGQNCSLTQSSVQANILYPNTMKQIQLQYIYMKGQSIISSNSVKFTTNTTLNLDNETLLIISSNDLLLFQPSSSLKQSVDSQFSISTAENLYMYLNQTLISFDSKLFSSQPTCYMLSEMTENLCLSKQCSSISPQQLYDMEIGTVIKNYSFINGRITLPLMESSNTSSLVYFRLQRTNHSIQQQFQHITQEKVIISGSAIINVSFEISQINSGSNISAPNLSSLRVDSPDKHNTPITYNVNITFTNSQPVYAIKTIKLYIGEQLIESNKVMFKPLQKISYSLIWRNDQSQIPVVEIYSQNFILQDRYSMNNYIDFLFNQQKQLLKNSPNKVIQNDSLNEMSIVQTHGQKSVFIIVIISVGGGLVLSLLGVWFFRKRIFKRCCYQQEKQERKQDQIKDGKNDQICEVPQTAKEMKDLALFGETQEIQNNKTSQINPEEAKNKKYFSIDGQNPQNQIPQKALEKCSPSTGKQIPDAEAKINPLAQRIDPFQQRKVI